MQLTKKIVLMVMMVLSLVSVQINQPANAQEVVTTKFTDVGNHWAKDTIQWALDRNMIEGYGNGKFMPDATVTESEFIAMLVRLYFPDLQPATDGQHWAEPYYAFAKQSNYPLQGYTTKTARDKVMNRTRVAELVSSADGVNYSGDNAIKYLLVFSLANGKVAGKNTVESYKGADSLTRAEALQFLKNFSEFGVGNLIARPIKPSDPSLIPDLLD